MYQPPNQSGPFPNDGYPPNYQQSGYPADQPPYQQPYPGQQPMYQPPKKKTNPLIIILLIIGGIILLSCGGCGVVLAVIGSHTASSVTNVSQTVKAQLTSIPTFAPTQAPTTSQHFKVGDQVTVNTDWKAVVNSVTTDDGGQFSALKSGDTYLVLDVALTNTSSKTQTVSSILMFTLKDGTGQKYDESIDTNVSASLGGDVEPGGVERGTLVYEVPTSLKTFTLAFEPDLLSTNQTIWDVSEP